MAAQKFAQTPRSERVAIAAANAGQRTGTGASTGIAGASAYTVVRKLIIAFTGGSNAETVLRIFKHDGTNYALLREVPFPARTVTIGGLTVAALELEVNWLLPSSSYTLRYSMETADAIVITQEAFDF